MPKTKRTYSKSKPRPKVTVPMHESQEFFEIKLEKNNIPDDFDLKTAVRGMGKIDGRLEQINDVVEKINNDKTLNDAGRAAEHVKFVKRMAPRVNDAIEKVTKIIDRRTSELSKKINQPITQEATGRKAEIILNHINTNLNDKSEVMRFTKNRIDAGDFETSSIILGNQPYLTGLDEENHENLLNYYREKRFAREMKLKEQLEKVGRAALHKTAIFDKYQKSITNESTLKDIQAQEARKAAIDGP